jgi:hypothetical protein
MRCPLADCVVASPLRRPRGELGAKRIGRLIRDGIDPLTRIAGTQRGASGYTCTQQQSRARMTKHLLAGVTAAVLISGMASAQIYPPAPPPGAVVAPAPPPPPHGPGSAPMVDPG